eukprot:CAMPEP_0202819392 /NCGR_PEP_ID=MMETSP1389-20130828/9043_1 /ASSEMBLY_ACC=CAM_ASM_000865 /TAXON_ID=302021 /ORGANISM="Rhodomonas sp., Strain CCMP768" /LENGTH=142 /DNA_ID=CAMNT_0049491925 /DNA_START=55 /DNA_END=483 /DNA_ORIENTATION=-
MDELQKKLAERRKKQGDETGEEPVVSSAPPSSAPPKPGRLNMGGFNPLLPGGGRGMPLGGAGAAAGQDAPGCIQPGTRSFSTPLHPSTPVGERPASLEAGMRSMSMGTAAAALDELPKRNSGPAGRRRPTHLNGAPVGSVKQ